MMDRNKRKTAAETNSPLVTSINNLDKTSKLINGVFVSQGLEDGTVEAQSLILEMLGISPHLDLDALESEKLGELTQKLKEFIVSIRDACVTNKLPCDEGASVLKELFEKLQTIQKSMSANQSEAFKDKSAIFALKNLKEIYQTVIPEAIKSIDATINSLEEVKGTNDPNFSTDGLTRKLRDQKNQMESISKRFSQLSIESLQTETILSHIDAVEKFGKSCGEYKNSGLDKLDTVLSDLSKKVSILGPIFFNNETFAAIKMKISSLELIQGLRGDRINEKSYLKAFENAFIEIGQMLNDLDTPFVKDVILGGKGFEEFKNLFSPLSELHGDVKPVYDAMESGKTLTATLQKVGDALDKEEGKLANLEKLKPLEQCISKDVKCDGTGDAKDWENEKTLIQNLKVTVKESAENMKNLSFVLPEYQQLETTILSRDISVSGIVDTVQKSTKYDKVKEELNTLKSSLQSLLTTEMTEWVAKSKIDELALKSKQWMEESGFKPVFDCFQNQELFEYIRNANSKLAITIENNLLTKINEAITRIESEEKNVKVMVEKVIGVQDIKRAFKDSEKRRKLKLSSKVSNDMAVVVRLFKDMMDVYGAQEGIDEILKAEKNVDDAINKQSDVEMRMEMKKIWNEKTKEELKNLRDINTKMAKDIDSVPMTLKDYEKIFETAKNAANLDSNIELGKLISLIRSSKMPGLDVSKIEGLDTMNLEFANSKSKINDGSKAFALAASFLGSMSVPSDPMKNILEFITTNEFWLVLALVSLIFLFFLFLWIHFCQEFKGQPNRKRKAFKAMFKIFVPCFKEKKEKDIEKGENVEKNIERITKEIKMGQGPNGELVFAFNDEKDQLELKQSNSSKGPNKCEKVPGEQQTTKWFENDVTTKLLKENEKRYRQAFEMMKKRDEEAKKKKESPSAESTPQGTILFKRRTPEQLRTMVSQAFEDNATQPTRTQPEILDPTIEYNVGRDRDAFQPGEDEIEEPNPEQAAPLCTQSKEEIMRGLRGNQDTIGASEKSDVPKSIGAPELSATQDTIDSTAREESVKVPKVSESNTSQNNDRAYAGVDLVDQVPRLGIKSDIQVFFTSPYEEVRKTYHEDTEIDLRNYKMIPSTDYFFKTGEKNLDGTLNLEYILSKMFSKRVVFTAGLDTNKPNIIKRRMFDFATMTKLIESATPKFRTQVPLQDLRRKKLQVVGDIHGKIDDLMRHLEHGFDDPQLSYLFLGDYVDRGGNSLEVLVVIMILKILYPKRFSFLRGNHEQHFINSCQYNSLYEECLVCYGLEDGFALWKALNEMFLEMPIAAKALGVIWCAHGGISPHMVYGMESVITNLVKRPTTPESWKLLADVTWSDPKNKYGPDDGILKMFIESERIRFAHDFNHFGLDLVMEKCGIVLVVRAHQVQAEGYSFYHGEKLMTIFGATDMAKAGNMASHIIIHDDMRIETFLYKNHDMEDFKMVPPDDVNTVCKGAGAAADQKAACALGSVRESEPSLQLNPSDSSIPNAIVPSPAPPPKATPTPPVKAISKPPTKSNETNPKPSSSNEKKTPSKKTPKTSQKDQKKNNVTPKVASKSGSKKSQKGKKK